MAKKKNSSAGSSSQQAGAATRGNEAGSSSEVVASGAGAGVAQSGAGAQYGVSGAEGISDVNQAESIIRDNVRGSQVGASFDSFQSGHLARLSIIGERIAANGVAHDNNMNSLNQHLREISLKNDDTTDTVNLAQLTNALAVVGLKLTATALEE